MITTFFKELASHFELPPVTNSGQMIVIDWRYHDQAWFEYDLTRDGYDDGYTFSKQFYGKDFEAYCREFYEIEKNGFYEWWDGEGVGLSWDDKQVEIEGFMKRLRIDEEMEKDYQKWLTNRRMA